MPLVLRHGNRRLGHLAVGGELVPLAEALVDAARDTGLRLLLTEHAAVSSAAQADETVDADEPLASAVRRLQADGHGVLCISGGDEEALAAADVGVGVLDDGGNCACWSADLVGGPGLEGRVARPARGGRRTSAEPTRRPCGPGGHGARRPARPGRRPQARQDPRLAPVHTSALLGLAQGARAGHRATRGRAPAPVAHVQWHALDPGDVLGRLSEASDARGGRSLRRSLAEGAELARALADKPLPRRALAPARAPSRCRWRSGRSCRTR